MTNSEKIWILVGIFSFAGSIGLLVGLREIIYRVNSIPVHNRLRRTHGDIELNYIEPSNSHYPDLLESPAPIHERFLNDDRVPSFYTGQHAPSYYSGGNPPSFNTMDRIYVNSSFEDNINLDFILIISLLLIFIIVIFYFNNPINKFPISTKNISTQEITYTKSYQHAHKGKYITYGKHYSYFLFSGWTIFDIQQWMNTFDDIDYVVTIELIGESYPDFNINEPRLILSWQFVVNKGSSPVLISTHIKTQSDKLIDLFNLELNDFSEGIGGNPQILISFSELYNYEKINPFTPFLQEL